MRTERGYCDAAHAAEGAAVAFRRATRHAAPYAGRVTTVGGSHEQLYAHVLAEVAEGRSRRPGTRALFWRKVGRRYDGELLVLGRAVNGWTIPADALWRRAYAGERAARFRCKEPLAASSYGSSCHAVTNAGCVVLGQIDVAQNPTRHGEEPTGDRGWQERDASRSPRWVGTTRSVSMPNDRSGQWSRLGAHQALWHNAAPGVPLADREYAPVAQRIRAADFG